ncbi:MAG: hypothetical protein RL577_29 [Bacteroidota bacterium]|jgi:hypothetical protein
MRIWILLAVLTAPFITRAQYQIDPVNSWNLEEQAAYDTVMRRTFEYFWTAAEPNSGMACERVHVDGIYPEQDQTVVTTGGTGFGLMAILAGVHRGYVTREQAFERFCRIVRFLEKADRFHGAWPHWIYGETGRVKPFWIKDDGGDLVETSFLLQGLLSVRQAYADGNRKERKLAQRIDALWRGVEFDWYTRGGDSLYWHWSPNYGWEMNFPVRGFNECHIMYVLGLLSPTHPISASVYTNGWNRRGEMKSLHAVGAEQGLSQSYGLQFDHQGDVPLGGPLFWAHYSYLGMDPRGLIDACGHYGVEATNMALINWDWCRHQSGRWAGYSDSSWGLTSSYSIKGYAGHAPAAGRDLGVISPTAALSSFPYSPEQSKAALMNWYRNKPELLGPYGFYDAFSESENWMLPRYLAIDQGPIVVMMENYRSALLWNLFMACPEWTKLPAAAGLSTGYSYEEAR